MLTTCCFRKDEFIVLIEETKNMKTTCIYQPNCIAAKEIKRNTRDNIFIKRNYKVDERNQSKQQCAHINHGEKLK